MKHDELDGLYCSVARTWSVIGERWTMMILRECFRGERRYDHFRSKLGLGSNVLNDRLRVLVDEGILDRVRYQDHPRGTKTGSPPRARSLLGAVVPHRLGRQVQERRSADEADPSPPRAPGRGTHDLRTLRPTRVLAGDDRRISTRRVTRAISWAHAG